MRTEPQRIVFLLFHLDPIGDEIGIEDITSEQKRVISRERGNRSA
jgi:hypothetical protein